MAWSALSNWLQWMNFAHHPHVVCINTGVLLASCNIAHKDKVPSHGRDVTALVASTHGYGTAIFVARAVLSLTLKLSLMLVSCHRECPPKEEMGMKTESEMPKRRGGWEEAATNQMAEVWGKNASLPLTTINNQHKLKKTQHISGHAQTSASAFRQHTKNSVAPEARGLRSPEKNIVNCEVLFDWTSGWAASDKKPTDKIAQGEAALSPLPHVRPCCAISNIRFL